MGDWTGTVPTFTVERARASKLQTLADIASALTGAWSTWSPTTANLTLGSGTMTSVYRRVGVGRVDFEFAFTLGAGSAVGTNPTITLPATPAARYVHVSAPALKIGDVFLGDTGTGNWVGVAFVFSGSTASLFYSTEVGAGSATSITSTAPFTWTSGDRLSVVGSYETA